MAKPGWRVGASFERFCLTAGVSALNRMMEQDAIELCGPRYGHKDGKAGYRWDKTQGKIGFHGGNVSLDRPRARTRDGQELGLASWEAGQSEDLLGRWAMNLMLINVSTRCFGRAGRLPEGDIPAAGAAGGAGCAAGSERWERGPCAGCRACVRCHRAMVVGRDFQQPPDHSRHAIDSMEAKGFRQNPTLATIRDKVSFSLTTIGFSC